MSQGRATTGQAAEPGKAAEAGRTGLRVKICGLRRNEDARGAEGAGADYLGVVLTPGFKRSVSLEAAPLVVAETTALKVAVLVDASAEEAEAAAQAIGASVIQLHGSEGPELVGELRRRGEWTLWKAVRARTLAELHRVVDDVGDLVDGLLVEGWRAGVVGGGGVRLALDPDEVISAIPEGVELILAGGLKPTTVADAVARFSPAVVDVSSGVERDAGQKDPELMESFVHAARRPPS